MGKGAGGTQAAPDMVISINQDDINHGIARNQFNCAIVRAIQRRFPDAQRVRANSEHIGFSIESEDTRYTFPTPASAVENVIKPFDKGQTPKPTRIHLMGGTVRPVKHHDAEKARERRDKMREVPPEVKANYPSARFRQMSPQFAEYDRFSPDE